MSRMMNMIVTKKSRTTEQHAKDNEAGNTK